MKTLVFSGCCVVVALVLSVPVPAAPSSFVRGDANRDGGIDIADPIAVFDFLFLGTASLRCLDAADGNDDGELDVTDPIFLLSFLFIGGNAPPPPFPAAGPDPTLDGMECSGCPFLAPQGREVQVLVSRLQINREVHPGQIDSVLEAIFPVLNVLGKLNEDLLLIYNGEADSRDLITIDLNDNSVKKVLIREQFLAIFNQQAQKPNIGTVTQLQSGWLLGFETTSNSLFAIREYPVGSGEIVINLVLDQAAIQDQIFPDEGGGGPPVTKAVVRAQSLTEFQPDEVLLVPATTNITSLHHLRVEEVLVEDGLGNLHPALNGHFILLPPSGEPPDSLKREGFLEFDKIRMKTGNTLVDVRNFPPVALPGTNRVLLFDQATDTDSFLELVYTLERLNPADPKSDAYRASVGALVDRKAILDAIEQSNPGGVPFSEDFRFETSFLHPGASQPPGDPGHHSLVLGFETSTKNVMAYNWSDPLHGKVFVFSSAKQLASRIDPRFGGGPETVEPYPLFLSDVPGNRIAFDGGSGDLLSLSYETGDWVVVLRKAEIASATGNSLVALSYLEAVDNDNLRVVDSESATVSGVRLSYEPVLGTCRK